MSTLIGSFRWLSPISVDFEKFDIQGVVFFSGPQQYMWYVEVLIKTYNAVDRTFYDAINYQSLRLSAYWFTSRICSHLSW